MREKAAGRKRFKLLSFLSLLLALVIVEIGGGCRPRTPPKPKLLYSPYQYEYTILIQLCKTEQEACSLAEQLRAARISNARIPSDGQWLVCVGRYISKKRADRCLEDLISRGWGDAVVLAPKPEQT
jgi:hypothetical protein